MSNLTEYDDIQQLLTGKEWRAWVDHLNRLKITRTNKALSFIRSGDLVKAQCLVAVIDDVDQQIKGFIERRKELQSELDKEE